MHLMIPFASMQGQAGREALQTLSLPHLEAVLSRMKTTSRDEAAEDSLSAPHERALARELGLTGADGALPWAAHIARRHGIETGRLAWGLFTPSHWRIAADGVSLVDPDSLALEEAESRALCDTVREHLRSEGWTLHYGSPLVWLAAHPSLAALPCASPDRVIGRTIDPWLPADARMQRRLQNDVQMLLHAHPVNDAREARGALAVNSVWLSGCGIAQPAREPEALRFDGRLRASALGADWAAWAETWHALDAGPMAELLALVRRGERATLTLCGERAAERFETAAHSLWSRLTTFGTPAAQPLLETL